MTIEEIKKMVEGERYDFLRTNPHLSDRIMFLTLSGSYAYGTNIETSDVDIRGCAMNSASDLIGLSSFEQVVHTQTDTTIYGFNKIVTQTRLSYLDASLNTIFISMNLVKVWLRTAVCFYLRERQVHLAGMQRSSFVDLKMLWPETE